MRTYDIKKPGGAYVSCGEVIPEKAEKIVIAVHGFTSSKDSPTVQLLMKRLPETGLGVVGIDLPGHGMGSSLKEELRIGACLESVSAAEEHIASRFPEAEICYFASSFGAYITGIRISTEPHRGRKAFFRSPAVNMPSHFMRKDLTEEEFSTLRPCVNIPSIGKLYVTYDRYTRLKKQSEHIKKVKESKYATH